MDALQEFRASTQYCLRSAGHSHGGPFTKFTLTEKFWFCPKMASDDQEKSRKVLLQLDPSLPSANIYPALVAIRTK
jgi:hypothetical protein